MVFIFYVVSLAPQFSQFIQVIDSSPVTIGQGLCLGSNRLETFDPL